VSSSSLLDGFEPLQEAGSLGEQLLRLPQARADQQDEARVKIAVCNATRFGRRAPLVISVAIKSH